MRPTLDEIDPAIIGVKGNDYGRIPMNRLLNEPVLIGGAIRAVLVAAMAYGFTVTPEQMAATMLAVEAVLALVTRAIVTPNQLAEARHAEGLSPTQPRGTS